MPRNFVSTSAGISATTVSVLLVLALIYRTVSPAPIPWPSPTVLLVLVTLGLWATGIVPEALTTLIFFSAAVLMKAAPPEIVFSGLGSSAFWMIFSGLILGVAIKGTGLSARIASALAPLLSGSQARTLAGTTLLGVALAFLLPSAMGRIVLIIPLLQDLSDRLGLQTDSRGRRGVLLGGILGTSLPSTAILPSNIPNNVLAGIYEGLFHEQISYSHYLWLHFPVLGLVKILMLVGLLLVFYRDTGGRCDGMPAGKSVAWSPAERRLSVYLAIAVVLWLTDGIHHVSPAWVGLGIAILCLMPSVGVLPSRSLRSINMEPLLYVSGVVGLGSLIADSGLGRGMAAWMGVQASMLPAGDLKSFLALCGLSTLTGTLTTLPGVPAILTPMTQHFAALSGLSIPVALATQVIGFSTVLFPYQAPPLVAALQLTSIGRWEMTRLLLMQTAISVLLLWPLDYFWLEAMA